MYRSFGILEVVGMTTAMICLDTMLKSAYVDLLKFEKIHSGFISIIIQGDLASVQYAIEVGTEIAIQKGSLRASRVIARPYEGIEKLF